MQQRAKAAAASRTAGGVTQLAGIDQALPFGKKKPTGPQTAGLIDFHAGADEASSASAMVSLQELIERMRWDSSLEGDAAS